MSIPVEENPFELLFILVNVNDSVDSIKVVKIFAKKRKKMTNEIHDYQLLFMVDVIVFAVVVASSKNEIKIRIIIVNGFLNSFMAKHTTRIGG